MPSGPIPYSGSVPAPCTIFATADADPDDDMGHVFPPFRSIAVYWKRKFFADAKNEKRFYWVMLPLADKEYQAHLDNLEAD